MCEFNSFYHFSINVSHFHGMQFSLCFMQTTTYEYTLTRIVLLVVSSSTHVTKLIIVLKKSITLSSRPPSPEHPTKSTFLGAGVHTFFKHIMASFFKIILLIKKLLHTTPHKIMRIKYSHPRHPPAWGRNRPQPLVLSTTMKIRTPTKTVILKISGVWLMS